MKLYVRCKKIYNNQNHTNVRLRPPMNSAIYHSPSPIYRILTKPPPFTLKIYKLFFCVIFSLCSFTQLTIHKYHYYPIPLLYNTYSRINVLLVIGSFLMDIVMVDGWLSDLHLFLFTNSLYPVRSTFFLVYWGVINQQRTSFMRTTNIK